MAVINPLETDPAILNEIKDYHSGGGVFLSDRSMELLELLTDPSNGDGTELVRMGRRADLPIYKETDILYPSSHEKIVVQDIENAEGVFAIRAE